MQVHLATAQCCKALRMLVAQCSPACLGTRAHRPRRRGAAALRVQAAFGEDVRKFFDGLAFENWAPRSSRTWRLPPTQRRAVQAGALTFTKPAEQERPSCARELAAQRRCTLDQ